MEIPVPHSVRPVVREERVKQGGTTKRKLSSLTWFKGVFLYPVWVNTAAEGTPGRIT